MKPDLVPWGNWFQSPSSYGFSCWQDWFEGKPKCQRQLPLRRRTLKDVTMIVNRVLTHMHTIFYNKLVDYSWFPQCYTWDKGEEDIGGSLCPVVEETRSLELQEVKVYPKCHTALPTGCASNAGITYWSSTHANTRFSCGLRVPLHKSNSNFMHFAGAWAIAWPVFRILSLML